MALALLNSLRSAYSSLNPEEVRKLAARSIAVELVADSEETYAGMEAYFLPQKTFAADRTLGLITLHRATDPNRPANSDLTIYEQGISCPRGSFTFYADNPDRTVEDILESRGDLEITLARQFLAFRQPAINRVINRISRENALFTLMTALPNVLPSFLELPWAVGEYATDSAFLTINQVRMAFLIAAASGRPVGLSEQKAELFGIVASAFGWRALARELVGKIPMGGGLIPKAAIAWAGTFVVGRTIEEVYVTGDRIKRNEHKELYARAMEKGREVAGHLLQNLRKPTTA
jgi:hypothetical protein